jgi:Na+-transporting methylmalonyl-CoA/oxaloacetate decarboxylase gamma subunit
MNMYSRTQEALFMTNIGNCVLGMGGMVLSYLTSILFMYFISYPVETSFSKSVRKNVLGRVYQEVKDKWAN